MDRLPRRTTAPPDEPGRPFCNVPGHDPDCDCGVDPDSGERF